jgi:tRNA A-37 threonylcarbamoyl transferase component Bud32/tetratricopeptide (TPR) repeat protein
MPDSIATGCLDEEDAVAYVRGEVVGERRAALDAHMDVCAACRRCVSALVAAVTGAPDPAATAPATVAPHDALPAGAWIGRYMVLSRLGAGAMGVVYAAYDPELDRKVAIKVMQPRRADSRASQARFLREARAMARLSHPGVVPIYDVGTVGDDVFLAMELVDGQDAQRWLDDTRPSWRSALGALLVAGRGLAAAHAAGIVHRDVKPANVMVGRDGRARVTDFGLARSGGSDDTRALDLGAMPLMRDPSPTRTGAVLGTPAYMAPEQQRGEPAEAAADQFSFCVLLYEAVYGQRPYGITDDDATALGALARDASTGRVRPPPPGTRVPVWLRRILLRGLAATPAARWPSMDALLDAIEQAPRRRRRPLLLAGGAMAIVASVAAGTMAIDEPPSCSDGRARLEATWSSADRSAALTRITGIGAYGRALAPRLSSQIDAFEVRWRSGYREACEAHRRGAHSAELLDRRVACLERARAALSALPALATDAADTGLPQLAVAVRSLPEPAECADLDALLADAARPPAALASRVDALEGDVERARILIAGGRYAEARDAAEAVVTAARELGDRPLLARALLTAGRAAIHASDSDRPGAGPTLAEASALALEVDDASLAVEAWAWRALALGVAGVPDAVAGQDLIRGLSAQTGVTPLARSILHSHLGTVALARGLLDEARAQFARALAEPSAATGPDKVERLAVRSNLALVTSDPAQRDQLFADAQSDIARLLGADHPEAIRRGAWRAFWTVDLETAATRFADICPQLEAHTSLAPFTAECWAELSFVAAELDRRAPSIDAAERAMALDASGVSSTEAAGYLALARGDARGAAKRFSAGLARLPQPGPDEPRWTRLDRAKLTLGLGRARRDRDLIAAAIGHLEAVARERPSPVVDRRLARGRAELSAQSGLAVSP